MPDDKGVIEFGDKTDPAKDAEYRKRIADAKGGVNSLKNPDPVGGPRPPMPDFKALQRERSGPTMNPEAEGVQPRPPGSPLLRPETADQIRQMADVQVAEGAKAEEVKAKQDAEDDVFGMLDFDNRTEAERILNNKKRRKEIEARCSPMSFDDLLIKDEVQQDVPIQPGGRFTVRYRSYTPEESLFIKRYIQKEQGKSDQYLLEKFALCQLCLSLVSINGVSLPDHRDKEGSPSEQLFEEKLKRVLRKDGYVVADLGINYGWFDMRVRRLINPDDLKNG